MSDYIMHHGIKGQRWGVRRYQNEDGSLTSAGQNRYSSKKANKLAAKADRTREKIERGGILKGHRIKKYHDLMRRAETAEAVSNAKGIVGKSKQLFGDASMERRYRHESNKERELASNSKMGLAKQYHKVRGYNMGQYSKYYGKRADIKTTTKVGADVAANMLTGYSAESIGASMVKVKTISGRDTTAAKEWVIRAFTAGVGNIALDVLYASDHDYEKDDY